jgi:adenosylcobinamide-GDP ribazoletransferase
MNPWQRLRHETRLVLTAVEFLTRIPIPKTDKFNPVWMSRCVRYFPWVGAMIGAFAASVWWVSQPAVPPLLAAALVFTATALLTGAFHEDGLSDYVDGMGGGQTREQTLTIMKDSRVGSFGALALVLVTLIKITALASMPIIQGVIALIVAHATARAFAVTVMARLPYARDNATSKIKPVAVGVKWFEVAIAWSPILIGFMCVLYFSTDWFNSPQLPIAMLAVLLSASLTTLYLAFQMSRRLGGYTGDALGAVEQCAEAAILITLSAWFSTRL